MYRVTYGEPKHYARAYVLHTKNGVWVFVGRVNPLTKARKTAIVQAINPSMGGDAFDANPFVRYDGLTIRPMVVTDLDSGAARSAIDYTHTMGSGEWALATTHLVNVR